MLKVKFIPPKPNILNNLVPLILLDLVCEPKKKADEQELNQDT